MKWATDVVRILSEPLWTTCEYKDHFCPLLYSSQATESLIQLFSSSLFNFYLFVIYMYTHKYTHIYIYICICIYIYIYRQVSLNISDCPGTQYLIRLSLNSQRSSCLRLPCAWTKGGCCYT